MSAQLDRIENKAERWAVNDQALPFADPFEIGVDDMLNAPPPDRRWLLSNFLPLGIVGLLAAGGGVGKGFLTMLLAVCVAAGRDFMGMKVGEPGGVLVIAAEDDREELHRRLYRIVDRMKLDGDLSDADVELVSERLFIVSSVGVDNRLTAERDGVLERTDVGDRIVALVDQLPPINLIVLDPVSRFRGGDENGNDAATRYIESVEAIRNRTGATILLPHHVSKEGLRAGTDALSVENLRGASGLVDGVRWAGAMATLRKDAADSYGVSPDDAGRYVRLDLVKTNYSAPWSGMWLERLAGGVLAPVELDRAAQRKKHQRENDRYRDTLGKIQGLIGQQQDKGHPLTRNKLRDFAGAAGLFGMSEKPLLGIVERAISEGEIREVKRDQGRGMELRLW